jgi:hypothetical protein
LSPFAERLRTLLGAGDVPIWAVSWPLGRNIYAETQTIKQMKKCKYVHEGQYVAEVEVSLVEVSSKLDDEREALQGGDSKSASEYGRIFELRPVPNP